MTRVRHIAAGLALAGLAGLIACEGCKKKESEAPTSGGPKTAVVTVTVKADVEADGAFRSGGFILAGKGIDGKDPNALTVALSQERAAATAAGTPMRVRLLIYPTTPFGVVRRALVSAAKAKVGELALDCAEQASGPMSGEPFALPGGDAAAAGAGGKADALRLRVWPADSGRQAFYEVVGAPARFPGLKSLAAFLASRKAGGGPVVVAAADVVQAGFVAEAMAQARQAGIERVLLGPAPLLDQAPARPKAGPGDDGPVAKGPKPPTNFAGTGGEAYHIVYLIDRSGSMVATFKQIRDEVAKSVAALKPNQDFHIVFFGGRTAMEAPAKKLIPATDENKKDIAEFIKGIPSHGQTQPAPAVERAFDVLDEASRARPGKLIYLLTDGDFKDEKGTNDNAAVLKILSERNANKDVVIHTILFGKLSADGEKLLKQIAQENGGKYKFVQAGE
jgi:hypothetical protein